ncbi:MAG: hypothetical protein AAF399_29420, partial [Bacteroidota bacterium]
YSASKRFPVNRNKPLEMNEERLTDLMDQYLLGQMSQMERQDFEAKMERDPALIQAVADHWQAISAVRRAAVAPLFAKVEAQQKQPSSRNLWLGLSVAAGVAFLLLAGWNRWWPFSPAADTSFAQIWPELQYPRNYLSAGSYAKLRLSWMAFRKDQLDEALQKAQDTNLTQSEFPLAALWRGLYHLETYRQSGKSASLQAAIPNLLRAYELGDEGLKAQTAWYLALSYHTLENKEAAKKWINLAALNVPSVDKLPPIPEEKFQALQQAIEAT